MNVLMKVFMIIFCGCLLLAGSAAAAERLSLMLLPPIGKGNPQLAVSWKGEETGHLELLTVDARGQRRLLQERTLTSGMQLASVQLSPTDQRLLAVLRDARGRVLARAEQSAVPGMPVLDGAAAQSESSLDAIPRAAQLPQLVGVAPKNTTEAWKATFSGNEPNRTVLATTVYDDGSGPALVIGGEFTAAGGAILNGIARWNGSAWSALGSGISGGSFTRVSALTVYNGELIAGGQFTSAGGVTANRIARWNGSAWSALGTGVNSFVKALTVYNGELIAGGDFTSAGGVTANRIARWNGSTWSTLGTGMNDMVRALTVHNGELIAGGSFSTVSGVTANGIARWNGSAWSALGSGIGSGSSDVEALTVYNGELIAGGAFFTAGGVSARSIARWNGSAWSSLGSGMDSLVNALTVYNGELIAGGGFTTAGGATASGIARWNGSSWSALGTAMSVDVDSGTPVNALTVHNGNLIAGGGFIRAGGAVGNNIARWDGSAWSALGSSIRIFGGGVDALTVYNGELIAGGMFTSAGGVTANSSARWNGSAWSSLGSGIGGGNEVRALTVYNGELIAGGNFTIAGGVTANNIARWNGSAWSALGTGVNSFVDALTVYNGELIAGGQFTSAGGVTANRIARWNGSTWSSLGTGVNGSVYVLTVYNGELIAGGNFTIAGGVTANNIARWNGGAWSALGTGIGSNGVDALTVYSGELIAGGDFTSAGGVTANRIARWNGSAWSALGTGIDSGGSQVNALTVHNGNLIAGGFFVTAGGVTANNMARWNGSAWSALDTGVNGYVYALTVYNGELIAGGNFTIAGGVGSRVIAAYGTSMPTTIVVATTSPNPSAPGALVAIRTRVSASTAPNRGQVTITGSPGGSCTALSLTPIGATTAETECFIRWNTVGTRALSALYVGGGDWQTSTSVTAFSHSVQGAPGFVVGGTLGGLSAGGSVLLRNTVTGENITRNANGTYAFATVQATGASYNVTVQTQPSGQTCTVANGSGIIGSANVTNVNVTCTANAYTVGGSISGLGSGLSVVLRNATTSENLTRTANGAFTFPTAQVTGGSYNVAVQTQPTGQTCTVANGSGTVGSANVTNVNVTCINAYTVGGSISGLGSGLLVVLRNATTGENLTRNANGTWTFATAQAAGATYNVTVQTQPTGQTCTVANGSGTVGSANVSNVNVTCTDQVFSSGFEG